MRFARRLLLQDGNGGQAAFVAVVLATYFSTFVYMHYYYGLSNVVPWLCAGALFVLIGLYGFAYCRRKGTLLPALVYFVVQIPLAAEIFSLSHYGYSFFVLTLLAGQSAVLLPRALMVVICGLILAVTVAQITLLGGWIFGAQAGIIYLSSVVFVVAFTQVAAREQRARLEGEQLATALSEANQKLREYSVQVEELATIRERNRLAREIHDSLGHYLTVINVQIAAASAVLESDQSCARATLDQARTLTQEGLAEVRQSVAALRVSPVERRLLPDAVAALVRECGETGAKADLIVTGMPRPLAPQAELTLYRAAQEGLTNVRKHAGAAHAQLALDYCRQDRVRLVVRDDGVGAGHSSGGFGLLGLRERVQLLGGVVRTLSAAGQGFTLEVELPA